MKKKRIKKKKESKWPMWGGRNRREWEWWIDVEIVFFFFVFFFVFFGKAFSKENHEKLETVDVPPPPLTLCNTHTYFKFQKRG